MSGVFWGAGGPGGTVMLQASFSPWFGVTAACTRHGSG